MWNKLTCCLKRNASPRPVRRTTQVTLESESTAGVRVVVETSFADPEPASLSSGASNSHQLQHTSHQLQHTSHSEVPQEQDKRKNNDVTHVFPRRLTKKCRSYPTISLDDESTVSQPDFITTIQCVSLAIYYRIKNRTHDTSVTEYPKEYLYMWIMPIFTILEIDVENLKKQYEEDLTSCRISVGNSSFSLFDERTHPFKQEIIPNDYFEHDPDLKTVYRFVCTLFAPAQLTAKCAIITMVFFDRILFYGKIDICHTNWKRILLGAVVLAYELWNKHALWSVGYCQLANNIVTTDDMCKLEQHCLNIIQLRIHISASIYASYYFDLHSLARTNDLHTLFEPLCQQKAQNQEATSRFCEKKGLCRPPLERSLSAENVIGIQRTKARLS